MAQQYQVLARKWRPQQFDDVVGQEHVTTTLKNAVGALAGPDRIIEVSDLEVGILEDRGARRTFTRLNDDQVSELLR